MPCLIGGCEAKSRLNCPQCQHYEPSQTSKYYHCNRFTAFRLLCDRPCKECATCEFHDQQADAGRGRPSFTGIDWKNKRAKAEYMRLYMREKRKANRDVIS